MKMYLNVKHNGKVETIDELNRNDFKSTKDFNNEKRRLLNEYRIASSYYSGAYWSSRSTKDWKN